MMSRKYRRAQTIFAWLLIGALPFSVSTMPVITPSASNSYLAPRTFNDSEGLVISALQMALLEKVPSEAISQVGPDTVLKNGDPYWGPLTFLRDVLWQAREQNVTVELKKIEKGVLQVAFLSETKKTTYIVRAQGRSRINDTGKDLTDLTGILAQPAAEMGGRFQSFGAAVKEAYQSAAPGLFPQPSGETEQTEPEGPILSRPVLVKNSESKNSVELVNGSRLLNLKIDPNVTAGDVLKPEAHLLRFRVYDAESQTFLETDLRVKIPVRNVNGAMEPVTGRPHEYQVELPESLFSDYFVGSTVEAVEIFNLREGEKPVSSGAIDLTDMNVQANNEIVSMVKIPSVPFVESSGVVIKGNNTLTVTIDPRGESYEPITGHNVTLKLAGLGDRKGEAREVTLFLPLPNKILFGVPQPRLVRDVNTPHTYEVKLTDAGLTEFLRDGGAVLEEIAVSNASDIVPSGSPYVLETAYTFETGKEVPEETETGVEIKLLDLAEPGKEENSGPVTVFVTLVNAKRERFVLEKKISLRDNSDENRNLLETVSFDFDDPRIDSETHLVEVSILTENEALTELLQQTGSFIVASNETPEETTYDGSRRLVRKSFVGAQWNPASVAASNLRSSLYLTLGMVPYESLVQHATRLWQDLLEELQIHFDLTGGKVTLSEDEFREMIETVLEMNPLYLKLREEGFYQDNTPLIEALQRVFIPLLNQYTTQNYGLLLFMPQPKYTPPVLEASL